MTIRNAEERDIPSLGDLLLQVCRVHHNGRPDLFSNGGRKYTDEQLRDILTDRERPVLVAADEQDVVLGYAFCLVQQHDGGAMTAHRTLYLDDLCVDEHCRGQHVGTALYEAVLALARERDCYNVTLNVWCCNEGALRFYETLGLVPQKIGMEIVL